MTFRVLLPPENQKERRHSRQHRLRAVNSRMASRTEGDHQLQFGAAWDPVVNDHAALPCSGRVADPATVPVPLKHRLP